MKEESVEVKRAVGENVAQADPTMPSPFAELDALLEAQDLRVPEVSK